MTKDSNKTEEHDHNCCEDDQDLQHKLEHAIKELPTLQDKVQAIALNRYLQQKKVLDKDLEKEINLIDLKYRKVIEPLLAKINQIVEGKRQLIEEDFKGVDSLLTEQELSVRNHYIKAQKFQDYWLKVLKNSEFGFEITQKDQAILRHLERIEGSKSQDQTKLSIKFFFTQNQWFTNTIIIKQFLLDGDDIKKSYGDTLQWKQGKNITIKIVKSKKKNKKTGQKKTLTKQVRQQSFFHFFDPIDLDDADDDNDDQVDDNDDQAINQKVQQLQGQHQMAQCIYTDAIPNSLALYLGLGGGLGNLGDFEFEGADEDQQEDDKPTKKVKQKIQYRNLLLKRKNQSKKTMMMMMKKSQNLKVKKSQNKKIKEKKSGKEAAAPQCKNQ